MPEKYFKNLYKKILSQYKVCFLAAVVVGFIAHFYKLTNWLPNWDSLVFRYDAQDMVGMGRWFLSLVCGISSFYDLPWLNGILAIIFHGLGAVCICRIFNISKNVTALLTGALVAVFPAVTSVMMYNYVADGYAISFLIACMSAMFLTADNPKYILSAVMITLSVGIYQAYIAVTAILVLVFLIDKLIFGKKDVLYLLKKSGICMLTAVIGLALYYGITMLLVKLMGQPIIDYQGASSAAKFTNIDIKGSLIVAYYTTFKYFFDFSEGLNIFHIINIVIVTVTTYLYIVSIIKEKTFKSLGKIILLGVYVILIPVAANLLIFVNCSIDYHNLMKMGYCGFYLLFIILYDRMDKGKAAYSWIILTLCSLLIFNHIVIANISYHKLNMAYEKSYGTLIRIADRIEQTENSENCEEVLVIGALSESEAYGDIIPPDMTGTTDGYILRADDEIVGQSVMVSALNDYCGKKYSFLAGDRKKALLKDERIKEMDLWPEKNSVAVVDNVIVINLGVESEK